MELLTIKSSFYYKQVTSMDQISLFFNNPLVYNIGKYTGAYSA